MYRNLMRLPAALPRAMRSRSACGMRPYSSIATCCDLGLERLEDHQGGDIARRFGEHDVARIDEELGDELEGVLRAGRDDDVVDAGTDAFERHDLEDVLAQRGDPLTRAVLQGDAALKSRMTRSIAPSIRSRGRAETKGMPPASETTSGRDATANRARTSEAARPAVRCGVVAVPRVEVVALVGHRCHGIMRWCGPRSMRRSRGMPRTRTRRPRRRLGCVNAAARRGTPRGRPRGRASAWRR